MSLSNSPSRTDHVENGVTTVFPFDFKIFSEADLVVISRDQDTGFETTLALGVDYTVSGVNAESGSITKAAGTSGDGLTIKRVVDLTQPAVLRNQSDFFPATHEKALDRIVMQNQQQQEEIGRSLKLPESSTGPSALPDTSDGEGQVLGIVGGIWRWVANAGADLASKLISTASNLGAGLMGFLDGSTYPANTVGTALQARPTLATLASGTGATLLGHLASFPDAVFRTQASKNEDFITPEDFGCDPTGVVPCHTAFQKAIDAAASRGAVLRGRGSYKFEGDVNARMVGLDLSSATITINDVTSIFTIGGSSALTRMPPQRIGYVSRATPSTTVPSLRVRGSKNGLFDVQAADYMQVYADTNSTSPGGSAANSSVAYCNFRIGQATKLELTTPGTTDGSTTQWINENHFYITRCVNLLIDGTYPHNHNKFYGGTFEGQQATITINKGTDNSINGVRFESCVGTWVTAHVYSVGDRVFPSSSTDFQPYVCLVAHTSGTFATDLGAGKWGLAYVINLAAGTERNAIECTWVSSIGNLLNTPGTGAFAPWVSDSGSQNHVGNGILSKYHKALVAVCGIEDEFPNNLATNSIMARRSTVMQKVRGSSGALPCKTDYLPVLKNDIFNFSTIDNLGAVGAATCKFYRTRLAFFDSKLAPITASAGFITALGGSFASASGNTLTSSVDQAFGAAQITAAAIAAGVAYVQASWFVSADSASTACVHMEITQARAANQPLLGNGGKGLQKSDVFLVTAIPTQGFCGPGKLAIKSDGTARWTNIFALDTVTSNLEAASSTVIEVASGTGTANNDIIGINLDDGTTHWTTIASGGGTTSLTITVALPSQAVAGSRVMINRWVAA